MHFKEINTMDIEKNIFFILPVPLILFLFSVSVLTDYCQSEHFNVTCGVHQVVVMQKAKYGRMRIGDCLTGMGGSLGCHTDVLSYMDGKCSGKQKCEVYVAEPELHNTQPCPKDYASYLEASYECVSGWCKFSIIVEIIRMFVTIENTLCQNTICIHTARQLCTIDRAILILLKQVM